MALRGAASSLVQRLAAASAESSVVGTSFQAADGLLGSTSFEGLRHASNQAVKQRIRAIKNIGKITKAMKMVAASKMRSAQVAVENSRGIVLPFVRILGDFPAIEAPKTLTVAVTSDRGLCGGLNSNIAKYTRSLLKMYASGDTPTEQHLATVGDKGRSQLSRTHPDSITMSFAETYKTRVTFPQASLIAEQILAEKPDVVRILFNKFHSAISFKPTLATVLSAETLEKQMGNETGNKLDIFEMEVAGERQDTLEDLTEFALASTLYNAFLENNCSEHASRMTAMENSTKSAGEMLSSLTLQYNRDRQAAITNELIEIISGAAALEDSS